jgi:cytochrome oxidase Cu insertion factor (SCO1/SenC/PrrC family)
MKVGNRAWTAPLVIVLAVHGGPATAAGDPGAARAPSIEYVPNAPGTYRLERIQRSPNGVVLDSAGRAHRLADQLKGKVTLLTFFYSYCTDPWGCPFATQLMSAVRARIIADEVLRDRVRFVSISFDPAHDTPEVLRMQTGGNGEFDWRYFTARSVHELLPLLDGFGQDVSVETDAAGRPARTLNHMLKMFLIDRDGYVREIYSLEYMAQAVVFNDIATLVLEERGRTAAR